MQIESWSEVPDGALVIEDTYNEVYQVVVRGGKQYLKHVGWQVPDKRMLAAGLRLIDFEPNCIYDQPWYRID